ncbi:hypothetical protein RB195_024807 [Necator americanus]|uniref:Reverse transcriptase domain-containing protein n=1 Tax=Necator americanus TaxID=51031 RepID=A0ABR1EPN8_NECAM
MLLCLTFIDLKKAFDSFESGSGGLGQPKSPYSAHKAERMLTEFDETCGCIVLQLNLQKTMFMSNGWVSDAPFMLNGRNISECISYVYLGRELNVMNDMIPELGRRRRAAWGAYRNMEEVVKKTKNIRLRAHLFNTTVLPALTYASEHWAFRKQEENAAGDKADFGTAGNPISATWEHHTPRHDLLVAVLLITHYKEILSKSDQDEEGQTRPQGYKFERWHG